MTRTQTLRQLLSPPMLAALLVLCLAVGGTAFAAGKITGKQIAKDTVTSANIKNKTIKTKDLSPSALSGLTGPAGPAGPAGATGPKGDTGPSNAYVVRRSNGAGAQPANANIAVKSLTVPPGKYTVVSRLGLDDISGSPTTVECQLTSGALVFDSTYVTATGDVGIWSCVNMAAVDLPAGATITLRVLTPPSSQVRFGANATIMATKVGDLTLTTSAGNG